MRQIKDEFRPNPYKAFGTAAVEAPQLTPVEAKDHNAWLRNTFSERAHKFCTVNSDFNLSNASVSEAETQRFQNCLTKYSASFNVFTSEKQHFKQRCADLAASGDDKFASLNY